MNATTSALPFAARRARVLDALGERRAMILPASPELFLGDTELRYHPDPDLHYLTGLLEPEAVAVLCPSHQEARHTLFVRPRDPDAELWTGPRLGPGAAREASGADAAYPIGELSERLPKILAGADDLLFRLGTGRDEVEALVRRILVTGRKRRQRKGRGPRGVADPGQVLDEMRLRKDAFEVAAIREAARISAESFAEAAAAVRPDAGEWEVEAALEAGFRRRGADGYAFPSIVAGGGNAAVLHYTANAERLCAGDLVLVDAGARWRMYSGDISRTFPVGGRFSPPQREVYDAVLAARDAAIAAVRPGAGFADVHRAAVRVLVSALVEFGVLEGEVDALARKEENYKAFFPHRTSHWLGLDVHDVGDYEVDGQSRRLEPGMVLTIEPGLYFGVAAAQSGPAGASGGAAAGGPAQGADRPAERPAAEERPEPARPTASPPRPVPDALRGIGVRIEDDVLVTEDGCEVLTALLPATADEMERMVG